MWEYMMWFKNDFIITNRTKCYFIENDTYRIMCGVVVGYNNINHTVTISYKTGPDTFVTVYRQRRYVWFVLEDCLMWLNEFLRDDMFVMKVIDLTPQLDGEKTVLELDDEIGDRYTIYYNGLRQNREDYIIDDENHTLTLLIDPIPTSDDMLSIEYWKKKRIDE